MATEQTAPQAVDVQIRVTWAKNSLEDATYVNMFAATAGFPSGDGPEEVIYLVAGSAAPPLFTDANAVKVSQSAGVNIEVEPAASLVMPLSRARQLVDLLSRQIETAEQANKGGLP